MYKLAIVIPYYKIDFFEKTLKSIASQYDRRFNLYIGNDKSPNDPKLLIDNILADIPYTYFDFQENVGGQNLALQWERILENIKEEWFVILGDDDTLSSNYVEEFYNHLTDIDSQNINLIRFTYHKIDEEDNVLNTFDNPYQSESIQQFMLDKLNWRVGSSLSENVFKTSLWKKYKFRKFPLAWHTDDFALLELSEFGYFYNIRQAHVNVRISDQSITGMDHLADEKSRAAHLFYDNLLRDINKINHKEFKEFIQLNYQYMCRKLAQYPDSSLISTIIKIGGLKGCLTLLKTYLAVFIGRFSK